MPTACIGIGSNLGDRESFLDRAVQALSRLESVRLIARSGNHDTAPEGGPPGQPKFLNGAVLIETDLTPRQLLSALQKIESDLGRPAPAQRPPYSPRTIDLDLLLYNEQVIDEPGLIVPHPRMHLRRFVLAPLAQIAPAARHPLLGATAAEMLGWLSNAP